jgi:hypothetical protein
MAMEKVKDKKAEKINYPWKKYTFETSYVGISPA